MNGMGFLNLGCFNGIKQKIYENLTGYKRLIDYK